VSGAGRLAGLALAAALVLASAAPGLAKTIRVNIKGLVFAPVNIEAEVGDTIEWSNNDFVDHTATASDRSWDVMLPKGKTGSLTLTKAGSVDYFCRFHPNMKGRITVKPKTGG
jgi:plastocyanin